MPTAAYRTLDTAICNLLLIASPRGLLRIAFSQQGHDRALRDAEGHLGVTIMNEPRWAVRAGMGIGMTHWVARHECGHLLQHDAYVRIGQDIHSAENWKLLSSIYADTGRGPLEAQADCIAAQLNKDWDRYWTQCGKMRSVAANNIINRCTLLAVNVIGAMKSVYLSHDRLLGDREGQ